MSLDIIKVNVMKQTDILGIYWMSLDLRKQFSHDSNRVDLKHFTLCQFFSFDKKCFQIIKNILEDMKVKNIISNFIINI